MTDFLNLILEPIQEVFLQIKAFVPNHAGHACDRSLGNCSGLGHQSQPG